MGFLKCQNCSRRFLTKIGFQNHSIIEHINEAKTQLDQLPRTIDKKIESASQKVMSSDSKIEQELHIIDGHKIENENKKPSSNQCRECTKAFTRQCNLKIHINTVHEKLKPSQCYDCPKAFSSQSQFTCGSIYN